MFDGSLFTKRVYTDDNQPVEKIVEFVSNVTFDNIIFVSLDGADTNVGSSWSKSVRTFEKALEIAQTKGPLTLIDVAPGRYQTRGHLDMPDNTMIRCAHRTVVVEPEPGYEVRNVFRMGSGCFIEGLLFEGWRLDSLTNPSEGFAVSFRPGAVITRAPYAHKIAVRTPPYWGSVAPPLDRNNGNPLVGIGAGVALADGAVCSPYSIYPNLMTWGATPVTHNGIGYCAKNGGLINAVNAVSLWCHKHFLALNGGQIILSSCSTQFGDYTLVSQGSRNIVYPQEIENTQILNPVSVTDTVVVFPAAPATPPPVNTAHAQEIRNAKTTIVDAMWLDLVNEGYTTSWTLIEENFTKRDAARWLDSVARALETGSQSYLLNFARGLFFADGELVYTSDKRDAFFRSFDFMGSLINSLPLATSQTISFVEETITTLKVTLDFPSTDTVSTISNTNLASAIVSSTDTFVTDMWSALVAESVYTVNWTLADEQFTKRDARTLLKAIVNVLQTGNTDYIKYFLKALYNNGTAFFSSDKLEAFIFTFNYLRDRIVALEANTQDSITLIGAITNALNYTLRYPVFSGATSLSQQSSAATAITTAKQTIINNVWQALVDGGYTVGWTEQDELFTRRDTETLIQCIVWTLQTSNEKPMLDFARGLFDTLGQKVYSSNKESAFIFSFNYIKQELCLLQGVNSPSDTIIDAAIASLIYTITSPQARTEPSVITAIGHTFTAVLAGVALTKIPPARNAASIQDSILEVGNGVVIASGQDDQGNAIFVGGLEINADTGELGGPPFEQAVNRIATKTSISRSF